MAVDVAAPSPGSGGLAKSVWSARQPASGAVHITLAELSVHPTRVGASSSSTSLEHWLGLSAIAQGSGHRRDSERPEIEGALAADPKLDWKETGDDTSPLQRQITYRWRDLKDVGASRATVYRSINPSQH